MKQRIETTGNLPELSTWHMDMQIHLTVPCRPQSLDLELSTLLFFLSPFLSSESSFPLVHLPISPPLFPPTRLSCCHVGLQCLPAQARCPSEMFQGMASKANSVPSPEGPTTLHTVSWGLLDVRALGDRQASRHGSDDGLLMWRWARPSLRHTLLPRYSFLPVVRGALLGL